LTHVENIAPLEGVFQHQQGGIELFGQTHDREVFLQMPLGRIQHRRRTPTIQSFVMHTRY